MLLAKDMATFRGGILILLLLALAVTVGYAQSMLTGNAKLTGVPHIGHAPDAPPTADSLTLNGTAGDITVAAGASVTVAWSSTGGTAWTLNGSAVAASGSQAFTVNVQTSFTFVVSNPAGSAQLSRTAFVSGVASGCGAYRTTPADPTTLTYYGDQSPCDPTTSVVDHTGWNAISSSTLPVTLVAGQNYYLTVAIGNPADPNHIAFIPTNNVRFDLNGQNIYGIVNNTPGTVFSNFELFDSVGTGIISCALTSTTNVVDGTFPHACISLQNQSCPAVTPTFHDFTVKNTDASSGVAGAATVWTDAAGSQNACARSRATFTRVKSYTAPQIGATRISAYYLHDAGPWVVDQFHIIPNAASSATQGIATFGAPYVTVTHGFFDFPCNTVPVGGDNFRAFNPDGNANWIQDGGIANTQTPGGSHDMDVEWNYAPICNNRFVRPRNTQGGTTGKIWNNYVKVQRTGNFSGGFSMEGDPDFHNTDLTGLSGGTISVRYNTTEIGSNTIGARFGGVYDSGAMDWTANNWKCGAGGCSNVQLYYVPQEGSPTTNITGTIYKTAVYVHDDVIDPAITGISVNLIGGGTGSALVYAEQQGDHQITIDARLRTGNVAIVRLAAVADSVSDSAFTGHNANPADQQVINIQNMTDSSFNATGVTITKPRVAGTQAAPRATATVTVGGGNILTCTPNANSAQYALAPTATLSGGGGSGGALSFTIDPTGAVNGCTVSNPGSGYTSAPTVSVAYPHVITYSNPGPDVAGGASAAGNAEWPDSTTVKACTGNSAISMGYPTTPAGTPPTQDNCP